MDKVDTCEKCLTKDVLWDFLVFDTINYSKIRMVSVCDECLWEVLETFNKYPRVLFTLERRSVNYGEEKRHIKRK